MRWLPELSVERPVSVIMLFVALCVLGTIAWIHIPLSLLPSSFSGRSLWMSIPYRDAQPRETEEKITLPVEDRLSDIQGLKKLTSRSGSGNASFSLEFYRSISMDNAYNAVVDRMERALPDLPDESQEYYIFKWNTADAPIMYLGVGIEGDKEEQYEILYNQLVRQIERIPGVGEVFAWGGGRKNIYIDFSRDSLMKYRLNQYEILQRMRSENFQLPSGRLVENGQVRYVRSLSKLVGLDDIRSFSARDNIQIQDIANVQYRLALSASISRIKGKDGAGMGIRKESDANTVETARAIHSKIKALEQKYDVSFFPFFDQGEMIQQSLGNLKEAAYTGGLFAIIVLFVFLRNMPLTLLIAACIPFALIISVSTMYLYGASLNILSLMGLMLAVGMVVDNAIVVVEAIYARRLEGEESKTAAIEGASEVALAISLSTLTTVAVFLPVILMNQDTDYSLFLGEIGFPIIIALTASLLTALVFTPLTTTYLKTKQLIVPRWIQWLTPKYKQCLQYMLHKRSDSMLALVILGALTITIPVRSIGCTEEQGNVEEFSINFSVPPQFDYRERLDTVTKLEERIEANKDKWGVKYYFIRLSDSSNDGNCEVRLEQKPEVQLSAKEIIKDAKENLPEIPGVSMRIGWQGQQGEQRQFTLYLRGEETDQLETISDGLITTLTGIEGVLSVDKELENDSRPELQLIVNRDALARYQMSASTIGWSVASALRQNQLPEQRIDNKNVDVIARFQYTDRADMDKLLDFPVFSTATMQTIPLGNLVTIEKKPSLGQIRRTSRRTSYPLTINLEEGTEKSEMRERVNNVLSSVVFPPGYGFDPPFDPDVLADQSAMFLSLFMSIVLVFLIMGALFESFLLPLAIISTVPMAALGAYWALYITGSGVDRLTGIGLVILVGVVVNNGIVLIELVNRYRQEGKNRVEALVEAGTRRFRPILMTALTTICGLLPMAMGTTAAAGLSYGPMGRVVTGGLIAGTLLTLFFVPLLYVGLDDMRQGAAQWLGWLTRNRNIPEGSS